MPPRRRPNAFEVSFCDGPLSDIPIGVLLDSQNISGSTKRKAETDLSLEDQRQVKHFKLPPAETYKPKPTEYPVVETPVIPGEELDEPEDNNLLNKPIRMLHHFTIFDPKHANEMVSLAMLEHSDGVDREFEGVGLVVPVFENDEDEGQEEDAVAPLLVRLSAILRCSIDYTDPDSPLYIETVYAWYRLQGPAKKYEPFYSHFYTPRRVAQLVISEAIRKPNLSLEDFLKNFTSQNDFTYRTYKEEDLWKSVVELEQALEDIPPNVATSVMQVPVIVSIFKKSKKVLPKPTFSSRGAAPRRPMSMATKIHAGDLDLAVLKPENQNATHVTPLIATLAQGYVAEEIVVVGPPPPPLDKAALKLQQSKALERLKVLVARAKRRVVVDYDKNDRIDIHSDTYQAVTVDGTKFQVGDSVLVKEDSLPGWEKVKEESGLRDKHKRPFKDVWDYFWYGQIKYFVVENQIAHVQWYYHSTQTLMGELGNPQELLISNECGNWPLQHLIAKVNVNMQPQDTSTIPHHEYFCRFMYEQSTGTIRSIDVKAEKLCASLPPPSNCLACSIDTVVHEQMEPRKTKAVYCGREIKGLAYGGVQYHLADFVLYRSKEGPANIGQIVSINCDEKRLTLFKVGRISALKNVLPPNYFRDERHLYLTDEKQEVPVTELVQGVIYAASRRCFANDAELVDWLDLSPYHFFISYKFNKLNVTSWASRERLDWKQIFACSVCCREMLKKRKLENTFLAQMEQEPMPTLDLFGGVGAFSGSMAEGSRCFKVVYAIEISPSASKTFQKNWHVKTANQCANVMLRYAIKSESGHGVEVPTQLFDGKTPVPAMPKPGEIKVITAGFPCQSHSTLNMFRKTEDSKSNLMLTTLAYIHWFRPLYVYLENVPGFLGHRLNATQASKNRVEGGIEKGGLKLIVRALTEMGYQVRFALMQAGSYGTPQRRVRFFVVAALEGHPLPEIPQPTHDFLVKKQLKIDCVGGEINPISVLDGKAAHPFVSIESATDDLLKWDFAYPKPEKLPVEIRREFKRRNRTIASVQCNPDENYWGFTGQLRYQTDPMTSYQKRARNRETTNIQHFVQPMMPKVVEKVMLVPLKADADYRDLPRNQHEWQFVDPMSSHGKKNYKPGAYTRLNAKTFFSTIVTNFGPTAKQSKVLHHSCLRTNTIRELARGQGFPDWFVFESLNGKVKHIQRQIGNAVPWQVGHALGRELREALFKEWCAKEQEAIRIDVSDDEGDDQELPPQPLYDDDDDDDDMYV